MCSHDPFIGIRDELRAPMLRRSFAEPTAVQSAVLAQDTRATNLRISSQTGSGKTVAIGMALAPDLLDGPRRQGCRALLVAPTRELAVQLERELRWLYEDTDLSLAVVTGGSDMRREQRALRKQPDIVVGTPGRLLDHLRQGALGLDRVQHVVLDEADQMLDMGFRDELTALVEALPAERRSHLVSATFPDHVAAFANEFQGRDALHLEGTALGDAHEDIEHVAYLIAPRDRYDALINELLMTRGERTLVFVRRRIDTAEVAELLARDGIQAQPLSGDLPQAQRHRALAAFRRGQIDVLVATDVAARGIDVPDIEQVVHLDLPSDAANYTHRSGRTGRAGKKGRSLLMVTPQAQRRVHAMLRNAGIEVGFVPPPSRAEVMNALTRAARRDLEARLAAATCVDHLAEAERLLATEAPEILVAKLLSLTEPELPTNPRDVRPVRPFKPKRRPGRYPNKSRPGAQKRGPRPAKERPGQRNKPTRRGQGASKLRTRKKPKR